MQRGHEQRQDKTPNISGFTGYDILQTLVRALGIEWEGNMLIVDGGGFYKIKAKVYTVEIRSYRAS